MCNDKNNSNEDNYMYDILKTILILQKESNAPEGCLDACDKKCLGCTAISCLFNTRPITIYTCGCCNTPLAMPISKDPTETTTSNIFRIEKLDKNTATFRVLVPTTEEGVTTYTAVNSFFTIRLDCICTLKCLGDTLVDNI